jgi:hypothetical protein
MEDRIAHPVHRTGVSDGNITSRPIGFWSPLPSIMDKYDIVPRLRIRWAVPTQALTSGPVQGHSRLLARYAMERVMLCRASFRASGLALVKVGV